jgi:O-antigen/teichoic acid export membrane protein
MTAQALSLPALWATFRTRVIERKFVRDVGVLTVANGISAALSLVQGILVARWLGPELYGVAALVMSYPNLVYTFFDARSSEASVKFLSEFHARGERERAWAMCQLGYMVDFAIAALAFVVVLLSAPWAARTIAHHPEMVGLIIVYTAAFIPRALAGTSYATLATLGRFPLIAWIDVLTTLLRVVLVLALVSTGWQVSGVVWGNAIPTAATGLLYGTFAWVLTYRAWGAFPRHGSWQVLRGRRREILAFLAYNELSALLGMIPKQLDVVLLGYLRNPTEAGYYKLAKSFAGSVSYIVKPLQTVVYPELAHICSLRDLRAIQQKTRQLALNIGLPLGIAVIITTLFVPFLLPLLVGPTYTPAMAAIQFLLIGSAVWLGFFWVRPLFLARAWVKEWTLCVAFFAICNLVGWLVIVPSQGYLGMSLWWLFSTVCVYTTPPLLIWMRMDCDEGKN